MRSSSVRSVNSPDILAGMISGSRRSVVLGVIAVSLAFISSAVAAETGRIAGRVTFPGGGVTAQVSDVDVCAYASDGAVDSCAKPDPFSGEYTIEGLAGGEYKVGFSSTGLGYVDQYYNEKFLLSEAEAVAVTVGQTTREVNAELHAAGQISGRATNVATGAPIEGIQVCVEPSVVVNCERTNANGGYTISELASGEYTLWFTPTPLDYLFYKRAGVVVTAGQVTSGVDVGLTEGGRITGQITNASTGEPIEGAEACAHEVDGNITQCGTTNASGEYTITLLNGRYTVEFYSSTGSYLAQLYGGEPPLEYGRLMFSPSQELPIAAPGTVLGIDAALQPGVFEEPANTAPPTISATAAVGDVLSCSPGSWTGDPAPTAFAYTWLRDGSVINGASNSGYTAQSADEGHSVFCEVYATNAAGNEIGRGHALSTGVTVAAVSSIGAPSGGLIAPSLSTAPSTSLANSTPPIVTTPRVTLTATKLLVSEGSAPVHVACSEATCQGSIELVMQVAAKRHQGKSAVARKETLVLATGSFSLADGKSRTVVLRLTAAGKRMLADASKHHPIGAKLMVSVKNGKATTKPVLAI